MLRRSARLRIMPVGSHFIGRWHDRSRALRGIHWHAGGIIKMSLNSRHKFQFTYGCWRRKNFLPAAAGKVTANWLPLVMAVCVTFDQATGDTRFVAD